MSIFMLPVCTCRMILALNQARHKWFVLVSNHDQLNPLTMIRFPLRTLKPLGVNLALNGLQPGESRGFTFLRSSLRKVASGRPPVQSGLRSHQSFRTIVTDASPVTKQSSQVAWKKLGFTAVCSFYGVLPYKI